MQFAQLNAFLAVAKLRSFSAAAEHLHLTQPAISKRIKQLEQQFDTKLFDRLGKSILLTPGGEQFKVHAERILDEIKEFKTSLNAKTQSPSGTLSLATSHHIGLHRLPPVLRQFKNDFPEVNLDIHFMDSEDACYTVANNQIALAIVTLPTHPDPTLELQTIWQDDLTVMLALDHPLAKMTQITDKQLLSHPAILPAHGTFTRELIDSHFADKKYNIILETNYLETIKVMVSVNLGWSILPASMLDNSVVALQLEGLKLSRPLGLVSKKNRSLASNAQAMIQTLERKGLESDH